MMLYSERKRIKELEAREATGQSIWSNVAETALRTKIKWLGESYGYVANDYDSSFGTKKIFEAAHAIVSRSIGREHLYSPTYSADQNFAEYIFKCSDENFPNVIEALARAIKYFGTEHANYKNSYKKFTKEVNEELASYRLSYSLENCEVIDFESREIHNEIVVPVLRLLTTPGWEKVESAYQDSLKELSSGNSGDAITDATTALQEGLRQLGCKGTDFAKLLASAEKTILKSYDAKYVAAIRSLVDWSSAYRSNKGDSHKVVNVDREDAWFVIHTVGILLLRLSTKTKLQEAETTSPS